jgi:hypothetical protein
LPSYCCNSPDSIIADTRVTSSANVHEIPVPDMVDTYTSLSVSIYLYLTFQRLSWHMLVSLVCHQHGMSTSPPSSADTIRSLKNCSISASFPPNTYVTDPMAQHSSVVSLDTYTTRPLTGQYSSILPLRCFCHFSTVKVVTHHPGDH